MIVEKTERMIAKIFNLTYNEINILVYYLLIPLSWAVMIDCIIKIPVFSPLFIIFWIVLFYKTRNNFSTFCDAVFRMSQIFLLKFNKIGWNYIVSSVIICVFIPILIYILLLLLL